MVRGPFCQSPRANRACWPRVNPRRWLERGTLRFLAAVRSVLDFPGIEAQQLEDGGVGAEVPAGLVILRSWMSLLSTRLVVRRMFELAQVR